VQGVVYKSTGSWYLIKDEAGVFRQARLKGKLKIDDEISSSNPIAVGDVVVFEEEEKDGDGVIRSIDPRKNYIIRVSPHNKNQKHIVASNLDLALLITTISHPRTSLGFIDRFLLTAEAYHIPAVIVVNKIDLLKSKHEEELQKWMSIYSEAGYQIFPIVAKDPSTIHQLQNLIKGKITLFSGHSGVGKSTLINQLIPNINLKTTEISDYSGKGQHTTTFAEMFDLPTGGSIIDTPGVKEFGLIHIEKSELSHYFPEMRQRLNDCKFNNCLHYNEPGCAIKTAVNESIISEERYINYLGILDSIETTW